MLQATRKVSPYHRDAFLGARYSRNSLDIERVIGRFPSQSVTPRGQSQCLSTSSFVHLYSFLSILLPAEDLYRPYSGEPQLTIQSGDCSPQWSIENEIRTIPGLGSFTAYTVGRGLLGFSRCKWINSHPPAVCHHFGGRALLYRRHANRLEIE
jgi:hypothetical protein